MLLFSLNTDAPCAEAPVVDALIRRIGNGDMDAFRSLYDRVHGNVFGFALSIVKNPHDAEDVLQETFLKIYANAAAYRPQGKPLAWVFRIARNIALDKQRRGDRVLPLDERRTAAQYTVEDADDRLLIKTLLTKLTDEERQILILHAVSGIKHREIAAVLGLPVGTVLSKYHRAVKRLKIAIEEEMDHDKP
ncbi:MAG: RNA polymerase sigma factor [Clostridia bacterium]|nr:RNA polymerase sigma factor [Clostridia bacterium]